MFGRIAPGDQGRLKFRSMVLADAFIGQDKPEKLYAQAGLDAKGIVMINT